MRRPTLSALAGHRPSLAVFALFAVLALTLAAPAFAAKSPTGSAGWDSVNVTLHSEGQSSVMLISGTLPEGTELPALVELSAPTGSQVQWAGEILTGSAEGDPRVEYEVDTRDGLDVYSFTLEKSLTGQIEVIHPELLTFDGHSYTAALKWTPTVPVKTLAMNLMVPPGAEPGPSAGRLESIAGPDGGRYLRQTVENPEVDREVAVSVLYTMTAPDAPAASTAGGGGTALIVILGVFALAAAGALIAIGSKARNRAATREERDEDDEPETEFPDGETPVESAALDEDDEDAAEEDDTEPPAPRKLNVVPIVVVAAIVFAAAFAVSAGSRGVAQGDTISMEYAAVDACTASHFSLAPPAGASLKKDADDILNALRSVAGLAGATVDLTASTIEVRYCDSSASADQILAALVTTGYTATPAGTSANEEAPTQ